MLPIGTALAAVRDDILHPGHVALPEVPLGTKDPDWIPVMGQREYVVITRDVHIRFKAAERDLLKQHGVRAFFLTGKKDLNRFEKLSLLVRSWDRIEKAVYRNGSGPWAMGVTEGRLTDLHL